MSTGQQASAASAAMDTTQRRSLATLGLAQFAIAMDFSIVYVAMPTIGADLGMEPAVLQWLVTAYALPFAGFLLFGGAVVDRLGARRVFVAGLGVFGAASILAGAAGAEWMVIAGRALQGVAAAFLSPAILALLSTGFPVEPARARAYSVWGAVGASGLAAGVVFGGVFTEVSWRLIFLVNIPIVLACIWGARRMTDTVRAGTAGARMPVASTALGTAAILLVVSALTLLGETADDGVVPVAVGAIALVALLAFLVNERRSATPLVARSLRRLANVRRGALAAALYMSSVGTEFFVITLFLQDQRDLSPLAAGIAFLPLAVLVTAGNLWAGRLLKSWSAPRVLLLGFGMSAVGLLMLATMLGVESFWAGMFPGLLVSGLGHGMVFTSVFVLGNTGVPAELSGAAGAVLTSAQYVSNAVGIAILTIIVTRIAGTPGFAWAFGFNAAVALAGAVLAVVLIRSEKRSRRAPR
ncbi:MFS transporter [Microbacterium halophytorum]|uniref:MFS transporter n=1 Tax=Microbacterium halophytorum TaxID=2067568 RepID=UPI000CFDDB9F|nr:MFS transporter [Microbacterium halophytorum]